MFLKCVLKLIWLHLAQYENWRIAEEYENLLFYALNYKCLIVGSMIKLKLNKDKQKNNVQNDRKEAV